MVCARNVTYFYPTLCDQWSTTYYMNSLYRGYTSCSMLPTLLITAAILSCNLARTENVDMSSCTTRPAEWWNDSSVVQHTLALWWPHRTATAGLALCMWTHRTCHRRFVLSVHASSLARTFLCAQPQRMCLRRIFPKCAASAHVSAQVCLPQCAASVRRFD